MKYVRDWEAIKLQYFASPYTSLAEFAKSVNIPYDTLLRHSKDWKMSKKNRHTPRGSEVPESPEIRKLHYLQAAEIYGKLEALKVASIECKDIYQVESLARTVATIQNMQRKALNMDRYDEEVQDLKEVIINIPQKE